MRITDLVEQVFFNIFAHKLRSILAVAGIVWGAYAVLMLSAVGAGIAKRSEQQLRFISKPSMFVWVGDTTIPYRGFPRHRQLTFSLSDILRLPRVFSSQVESVSPFFDSQMQMIANGKSTAKLGVTGVSPDHFVMNPERYAGRVITKEDVLQSKRVIFLSLAADQLLFETKNPIGKSVVVGGIPFTVVGYVRKERGGNGATLDNSYIPYTTYVSLWQQDQQMSVFQVLLHNHIDADHFQKQLTVYFAKLYDFSPDDSAAISAWNSTGMMKTLNTFFLIVQWFLIFCGLMTLGVGGVGVANMMYFIVEERTREIGLAMALGARPVDVLSLVLGETIVLIGMGSIVGVLAANASLSIFRKITLPEWIGTPQLTWSVSIFVAAVLLCTAVAAGIFPARKAALMTPVEALEG